MRLTNEWHKNALARAVPGAAFKDGWWVVEEPDARAAAIILRLFPEASLEYPELLLLRDELLNDVRPFDAATEYIDKHPERRIGQRANRVVKIMEGL